MRQTKLALALLTAAVLAACGGTSPSGGDQTQKLSFTVSVLPPPSVRSHFTLRK